MENRRFYLSCIAVLFLSLGLYGVARYFFPLESSTAESLNSGLRSGLIDILFASCMGWDAWRAHQKLQRKPSRRVPVFYPRTEAAIYGIGALIVLAGAGFYGKLTFEANSYSDGFTRARDIAVVVIGLFVAAHLLRTAWRAIRSPARKSSEAGEKPFTLP